MSNNKIKSQLPTLLLPGNIIYKKDYPSEYKTDITINVIIKIIKNLSYKDNTTNIGNNIILLKAGTSSGKSVTVAPYCYLNLLQSTDNILLIQPKVFVALDVVKNIEKYNPKLKLGENLGYITGDFKLPSRYGLNIITYGVLIHFILSDFEKFVNKYKIVILDEIHERNQDIDLILYLLNYMFYKKKLSKFPILIIMSATFDPNLYISYYNIPDINFIEVKGRTFNINENYAKIAPNNINKYIINLVKNIHINNINTINNISKDIIIFVDTISRANIFIEAIHKLNSEFFNKKWKEINTKSKIDLNKKYILSPILVTRQINIEGGYEFDKIYLDINDYQEKIYSIYKKNNQIIINKDKFQLCTASRKVYIGTNVMESGVTFNTLKYCIDTGYQLSIYFDPNLSSKILLNNPITKDNALQRKGRVGRLSEGEWYPAYTKDIFNNLQNIKFADIISQNSLRFWLNILLIYSDIQITPILSENINLDKYKAGFIYKTHILEDNNFYEFIQNNIIDISNIKLLEIPPAEDIKYSFEKLHGLGFINRKFIISPLIYYCNPLNKLSLESIKFLLSAYYHDCNILQVILIISCIELFGNKNIFSVRKTQYLNPLKNKHLDLFINDDLINYLFLWENLFSKLEIYTIYGKNYDITNIIIQWCTDHKINLNNLLSLINYRNELIEHLFKIGLNPYYNNNNTITYLLNNDYQKGLYEIKKIKNSLYESYIFNILKYNKNKDMYFFIYKKKYVSINSDLLSKFNHFKPLYLITPDLILSNSKSRDNTYNFLVNRISILDTFVNVDEYYLFD